MTIDKSRDKRTYKYSTRSPTGRKEDEPGANTPSRWRKRDRADRWERGRHDRPRLSEHVIGPGENNDRWDERTPSWAHSPEYAYIHGVEVENLSMDAFTSPSGNTPDRVRVFGERTERGQYAVVILICNGCWTTVYELSDSCFPPIVKHHLFALLERKGHFELDSEPHEGVCDE